MISVSGKLKIALPLLALVVTPIETAYAKKAPSADSVTSLVFQNQTDDSGAIRVLVKIGSDVAATVPCTESITRGIQTETCEGSSYYIFLTHGTERTTGLATLSVKGWNDDDALPFKCKIFPIQEDGLVTIASCK